jgi:hypothetical protein
MYRRHIGLDFIPEYGEKISALDKLHCVGSRLWHGLNEAEVTRVIYSQSRVHVTHSIYSSDKGCPMPRVQMRPDLSATIPLYI